MVWARLYFFILFLVLPLLSRAQTIAEDQSGSWLEFSGNNKIGGHWSIPLSGILKHNELFEQYHFSFIRTGVTYQFNSKTFLTGGVAYVHSKSYTDFGETTTTNQYWLYEEFSLKPKFGRGILSHRWRLENRWINNADGTQFKNRARYRLQFTHPLNASMFIIMSNEVFANLKGQWFNQNRFHLGIGRKLSPSFKADIGYIKVHFKDSHLGAFRMGLNFTTDFRRKEIAHNEK